MKARLNLVFEQIKPTFTSTDIQAIIDWIKTNIMDKLPSNATATYVLSFES